MSGYSEPWRAFGIWNRLGGTLLVSYIPAFIASAVISQEETLSVARERGVEACLERVEGAPGKANRQSSHRGGRGGRQIESFKVARA